MDTLRHETYMKRMAAGPVDEVVDTIDRIGKKVDMVNRPPHYNTTDIECIDAIKAATGEGFHYHLQGTMLKYLWRFEHKGNALQDLRKAAWYLDRLIDEFDPTTD